MSAKFHDILRILQWLVPALVTFYGVLDKVFGWGFGATVATIATALVTLIGVIVEHDSREYFKDKAIVGKEDQDGNEGDNSDT